MIAIETEHGRYEAETEREALKLARKGARAVQKAAEEKYAKQAVARVRAEAQAFRILRVAFRPEGIPKGYRFHLPGSAFTSAKCERTEDWSEDRLTVETADGRGSMTLWRGHFVGSIENGAGHTIAVVINDADGNPHVYAVGTNEGEAQAELIVPKVTPDMFPTGG